MPYTNQIHNDIKFKLMNSKTFTQFAFVVIVALFTSVSAFGQSFNGNTMNTAGNSLMPSTGTGGCTVAPQTAGGTTFNATVAGLVPGATLTSLQVNFTHTWDADVNIWLQSPTGQVLELSTGNGGSADNYTNTVFIDGAPNITGGAAPFTGMFAPEGSLTDINCGDSPTPTVTSFAGFTPGQNGTWQLRMYDSAGGDIGTMIGWTLNFTPPPSPCLLECPADIAISLDPGFCNQVVNYPLPDQVGECLFSTMVPGTLTQNLDTTIIQDAVDCAALVPTSQ
jgi:subtilisin-like proprotein convertase family protein